MISNAPPNNLFYTNSKKNLNPTKTTKKQEKKE